MTEEPVEIEESFTASPAQPGATPMVLEAPLESPAGPDQKFSGGLTESPCMETDPETCPAEVSNRPQSTPTEPDGSEIEPEDEPTEECDNPSQPISRPFTKQRDQIEPTAKEIHHDPKTTSPANSSSTRWIIYLAVPEHRHSCHTQ